MSEDDSGNAALGLRMMDQSKTNQSATDQPSRDLQPGQAQVRPPAPAESLYLTPPSSAPPLMHTVLIGQNGLRVPWRVLVYLVMGFAIFSILEVLIGRIHGMGWVRTMFCDKLALTVAAILPAFVMARLEHRSFECYGLPWRNASIWIKKFLTGAVWAAAAITLLLLVLRSVHAFYFGSLALHGTRLVKFAVFWGAFFVLVALSEEFLVRGYTLFTLTQGIGFWPAAVLFSIAFGAIHLGNTGESWVGVVAAGVIGFFLCLTLRRTGDLWFAVGFHASWDWAESYLYSVPDSGGMLPGHLLNSSLHGSRWLTGGSVGPEGSVLVFVVVALTWVAFDRTHPEAKYPPTSPGASLPPEMTAAPTTSNAPYT